MFKQAIFLVFIFLKIIAGYYDTHDDLIVETTDGKIEGHIQTSLKGRKYVAFEGIPYAEPPIGELRFEEPKPVNPWNGIWKANTLHKCLQYNHYTEPGQDFVVGQEDCLYLNVYTPQLRTNGTLYDVIIFIHGGAFMFNYASAYGPSYLLDRDVIYVNINYRLGPLGFLSTEDATVPGNNGLKDQVLALKWVKQNIDRFNGNPDSITLTGMSAGGASVHLHLLSPLSKGLFHRGIIQSGAALNPWVLAEKSGEKCKRLASIVGCNFESTEDMVNCMKTRSGYQIADAVKHFLAWLYNPFSPFGAVVDKWSENPMLPAHPYQLLKRKQVQDVPVIFSNVEAEGLYPAADFLREPEYFDEINNKWNDLIPFILDYNNTVHSSEKNSISEKIRSYYMGDDKLTDKTFSTLVKMVSDRLFLNDIEKSAKLHAAAVTSPVYFSYFSYRGAYSKSQTRSRVNTNFGASHGDDTIYVLSCNIDSHSTEADRKMSEILVDMWTSFAHNGVPKLDNLSWTRITKNTSSNLVYAHIESPKQITMKEAAEIGNAKFWNSLRIQENEKLFVNEEL